MRIAPASFFLYCENAKNKPCVMLTIHWQWNLILFCHVVMFHWVLLGSNITIGHDHVKCWWHSSIIQHALGHSSRHNFLVGGSVLFGNFGYFFHYLCIGQTFVIIRNYSYFLEHVFTFNPLKSQKQYVCICLVIQ